MAHRFSGDLWSLILAGCCLSRAASYYVRPPDPTVTTSLIEGDVGYTRWAGILVVAAVLILAGHWAEMAGFLGHLLALGCYSVFSISIAAAAILYGQPWSGLMPVVVVALLHTERVFTLGATHGRR